MAHRIHRGLALKAAFGVQSVAFPRLSAELVGLNWGLSRSLVTPFGSTVLNGAGAGTKGEFGGEVKLGAVDERGVLSLEEIGVAMKNFAAQK